MNPVQLAFVALLAAFTGMHLGSSLLGMGAILLATLALVHQGHPILQSLLGGAVFTNTLTLKTLTESKGKTYVYIVTYSAPTAFTSLDFVFDYNNAFFDDYQISPKRKSWYDPSFNYAKRKDKGLVVGESTKLKCNILNSYSRPEGKPQFLENVIIQFYYYVRPDAVLHKELLTKFKNLMSVGQFRQYTSTKNYSEPTRMGSWTPSPSWI